MSLQDLQKLQTRRAELAKEVRDYANKATNGVFKPEDEEGWKKVNADYDANLTLLNVEREKIERDDKAAQTLKDRLNHLDGYKDYTPPTNSRIGRDGATLDTTVRNASTFNPTDLPQISGNYRNDDLVHAMQGWLLNGSHLAVNINDRHRQAASNLGQSLSSPVFVINLNQDWQQARNHAYQYRNALSGEDGAAGGYTKDQTLINNLELAMLAYGGVMQVAEIIRTMTGEPMRWPTADDTAQTGVQLGENTSHAQSSEGTNDPTWGSVLWNAYTFSSRIVKVPNELMTDSVFNLAQVLGRMLGERLGRVQNTKYTTGSGAGTAKGIVTCAATGVTAASATAIVWDELIDLEHSLDPSRRSLPGVGYMLHDTILKTLRKLKDGEGRYLWQSGANSGVPDTLNARPYTVNQDMASAISSGATTVLFGEMPMYKVRQVGQIVLRRLDERFADTNQTGFLALMRGDGNLLDPGDHPIKKLVQP